MWCNVDIYKMRCKWTINFIDIVKERVEKGRTSKDTTYRYSDIINQFDVARDLIYGVQRGAPTIILMGHKTAITDGPMGDNTP